MEEGIQFPWPNIIGTGCPWGGQLCKSGHVFSSLAPEALASTGDATHEIQGTASLACNPRTWLALGKSVMD